MIHWLHQFFETNRFFFVFVYGQVFFAVGLAIALQSWRYSRLSLVRSLPFLAVFGVANGLAQWGKIFIPLQAAYLPPTQIAALEFARISLLALSFAALMRFGLLLLTPRRLPHGWAIWLPVAVLVVWEVALVGSWLLEVASDEVLLGWGEALSYYCLAGPSAFVAALGLQHHVRQEIRPRDLLAIERHLRTASLSLITLAVMQIVFVAGPAFSPAYASNGDLLERYIGVPVYVFLSILGVVLAYSMIRAMEIFQIEMGQALQEAARTRLLMADRERIGRELHDGTIQSIYAAGLVLESASYLIDVSPVKARNNLAEVMQSLNDTIQEIRRYIYDLRAEPEAESIHLVQNLGQLARDLDIDALLTVDVVTEGKDPHRLTPGQHQHILRIAQEAFVNTARHARAKRVDVRLQWGEDRLSLRIADDGIGFTFLSNDGHGHGLRNMHERANLLGGMLEIDSDLGGGVIIDLEVPYQGEADALGVMPVL